MIAILRALLRPEVDVSALLREHPTLKVEAAWKAGERRPLGPRHGTGGFNVELATAREWPELLARTLVEARELGPLLARLAQLEAGVELELGLEVGEGSRAHAPSALFSSTQLRQLADLGIALRVSAAVAAAEGS